MGEFGPHDRPAENGSDHEKENDALACGVGVLEGEEDSRSGEHDMAITDGRMETRAEGDGNFGIRIAESGEVIDSTLFEEHYFIAGWSSQVARQAHNLKAAGSNPAPATIFRIL